MDVTLTPELEEIVKRKVRSGRFNSPGEVVRESLYLLDREDEVRELRKDLLRRQIMKGVEQIEKGEYIEITSEQVPEYAERIARRGRERRDAITNGGKKE